MLTLSMLGPCLTMTSYPRRIPLILSSGGGFQVTSSRDPFSWTVTFRGNTDGTEKDKKRRTKRVRSRNNYKAAKKRRHPLKSFCTDWRTPASEHGGKHPAKQSPMVRVGRKFRGAPPLRCFFRVSYAEIKWIWHFCDENLLHTSGKGLARPKKRINKSYENTPRVARTTHTPPSVVLLWIHVLTGDAPTSLLQDTLML